MYDEQQRLSRLITDVYNAALNPSFWVDVLRSAAGFVGMAAMESPYVPEVIARSYRLTPAELRVLFALVEVGGVSEVAATLGIASSLSD
jgi:hypothetical protein